jgi:hypothetical protein
MTNCSWIQKLRYQFQGLRQGQDFWKVYHIYAYFREGVFITRRFVAMCATKIEANHLRRKLQSHDPSVQGKYHIFDSRHNQSQDVTRIHHAKFKVVSQYVRYKVTSNGF